LFHLHEQPASRGVSELGRALKLPKSTAHRLLASLSRRGLVERDALGRYRPGIALVALGLGVLEREPLVEASRPVLERSAETLGETIFLSGARAGRLYVLDKQEGSGFLRAAPRVGSEIPAHATAIGKVYLAFAPTTLPGTRAASLHAGDARRPARLAARTERVRAGGVAEMHDEWIPDSPAWRRRSGSARGCSARSRSPRRAPLLPASGCAFRSGVPRGSDGDRNARRRANGPPRHPRRRRHTEVWIEGRVVTAALRASSVTDHGLLYGDGVFEGIRPGGGRVFRLDRTSSGCATRARSTSSCPAASRQSAIVIETARAFGQPDGHVRPARHARRRRDGRRSDALSEPARGLHRVRDRALPAGAARRHHDGDVSVRRPARPTCSIRA
jgi:DNA-binding IclR family transcriptional regulator